MADKIKLRRDTKANWEAVNPILDEGEIGVITDRNTVKIGDGTHGFNDLHEMHGTPESWVNVKDFGAKGDGITDDSLAIQAAIDSIDKGTIFFPSGEYITTKSINITKGYIKLIGCGVDSTIIHKTVDSNDGLRGLNTIISIGTDNVDVIYEVGIENLTLKGNILPPNYDPIDYTMIALYGQKVYNSSFINITTIMVRIGVQFSDIVMSIFQNIHMLYSAYGLRIVREPTGYGGTSTTFLNCFVLGAQSTLLRNAYNINGLDYSSMISCGTDSGTGTAYSLTDSNIIMNNCAFENWHLVSDTYGLINIINSYIMLNNFKVYNAFSDVQYGYLINGLDATQLILNNFSYMDVNNFFKLIKLQNPVYAIINAPNIPKNQIALGNTGNTIFNNMYGYQEGPFAEQEFYLKLYSPTKKWKIKVDDTGALSTEEIV